ncbi:hypothetical protein HanRHA438_Chr09g0399251 [Helianthus annuus]|uniref:Uncharacterized protein n=1 Tax=Helianthus annuus TaxID=4232 RepID=A0A251TYK2_HELAN|nr:uncharacterized protein At3g27210 [Helianthus annuus]KAF5790834.1 hypothetical protein HanXRQr2_Chr09g0387751 [Helianthus annuus]KAJ0526004.1 hypothetical protein HanHA300_Chr09g0318341 [Helianthus annuus]KAJ0534290.1 hypothetical protein HanIR_Chr09g0418031 [Helianthus annuus]KAJ0542399.1 hypothetical protein HanHA89_Chr09g0339311 [Helianthus annuus]KAJ0707440.1 hypothetical protein HanLR1_Chr09g0318451 [Helianthus annuus]
MGACVSNHQKPSGKKVQALYNGSNDIVKPPIINGDLANKSKWSPSKSAPSFQDFGSKEETFFDSQAWLDSDCDDDFMSVNGEFTPSRGNTPVHHNFSAGNNKPPVSVSPNQPSPHGQEKKMRLSDLFNDSLRGNYDSDNEDDGEAVKSGMNSKNESPLVRGDEVAPIGGNVLKTKRERFGSCFPSLLSSSRSSSMNGRKMMSPSPNPVAA